MFVERMLTKVSVEDTNKEIKAVICLSIIHTCARSKHVTEEQKLYSVEQAVRRAVAKCRVRLSEILDQQSDNRASSSDVANTPGNKPPDQSAVHGLDMGRAALPETLVGKLFR
jgi:hypothetical protein